MLALTLGLVAALAWAVHDTLARKLSQDAGILLIALAVLVIGCVALIAPVFYWGDWTSLGFSTIAVAMASGLAFACAITTLYKAFSIAPVKLVSPIVGAYPVLSLGIAALQGRSIAGLEWLAVAMIVGGIAIVALSTTAPQEEGAKPIPTFEAIAWAVVSAIAFASTFALGQEAARQGSEWSAMAIGRVTALLAIIALLFTRDLSAAPDWRHWKLLVVMGCLDAIALGVVIGSGRLPQAEYASISSALFGVLTILLAARYLKEQVNAVQWAGIATVFSGIGLLSLQG